VPETLSIGGGQGPDPVGVTMSVAAVAARTARVNPRLAGLALALAFMAPATGHAAGLINGSFEQPGGAPIRLGLGDNDTTVTGWTAHDGTQAVSTYYESSGQDGIDAADGTYYVSFGHNGATGASLTQSIDTLLGAIYTLNYQIRLQQGSDPLSGFQVSASTGDSVYSGDAAAAAWTEGAALTFTGTGSSVTLTILDSTVGGGGSNLAIDNLRLSSVGGVSGGGAGGVPEPASWALLIAGFGGAGGMLRARRRHERRGLAA